MNGRAGSCRLRAKRASLPREFSQWMPATWRRHRTLAMERLEDRRLLAIFTVNNLDDSGPGSLRDAILMANAAAGDDEIQFSVSGVIGLTSGQLEVTDTLSVTGPAQGSLTIDAQQNSRIIHSSGSGVHLTVTGLTLTGGRTGTRGGAIYLGNSGELKIENSTITGNSADGFFAGGGGIYAGGTVEIVNSTVSGNHTTGSFDLGGGILVNGPLTLTNSTVSGNSASGYYGSGGGVAVDGSLVVISSTITDNAALASNGYGGGIYLRGQHELGLRNSIIAGNSAGKANPDLRSIAATTITANYNLIGDTSGLSAAHLNAINFGSGNLTNVAPLLGPLAYQGGSTQTHAILPGSPAIDSGDPAIAPSPTEFDQRGAPFVRVANAAAGLRVDMGAYERQSIAGLNLIVDTPVDEVDADTGVGDLSLREAIGLANGNAGADVVSFDNAAFGTEQSIMLELGELDITDTLTIVGPGQELLTLNAQQQSRILYSSTPDVDLTVKGVTLTGGRTTASGVAGRGGAIRSRYFGTLTVEDSTVIGNSTSNGSADGGGLQAGGDIVLSRTTIHGNSTTGDFADGGGIFASGTVTLADSTVTGNVTTGEGASGGGLAADVLSATDSTISSNFTVGANSYGGAASVESNATLTRSSVSRNTTLGQGALGGGLFVGALTVTDSTISGNRTLGSGAYGGGIFARNTLILRRSTVSGNSTSSAADAGGGGIFAYTNAEIIESTITNNLARHPDSIGGGVLALTGDIDVYGSIIAGNSAGDRGHDLIGSQNFTTFTVNYSVIGDNDATPLVESQTVDAQGNFIGSSAGGGVIDPLLTPLGYHGGPTQTHALLPGSPALDAGDPGAFPSPNNFDQRGAPYVRIANGAGGLRIDMGAYERQSIAGLNLVVDTPFDEVDGDTSAGDLSLREAIGLANGNAGADTIAFDPAVFGTPQEILLVQGELDVYESLTIAGPGQELLTINAQQISRVLYSSTSNVDLTVQGVTLTGGRTFVSGVEGRGGAIRSRFFGTLTIEESTITGNSTANTSADGGALQAGGDMVLTDVTVSGNSTAGDYADGGGIFASGDVTLASSTVSGNTTAGEGASGGGVYAGGTLTVTDSTVSDNSTFGSLAYGGGIYSKGDLAVTNSTVSGNTTSGGGGIGGGIIALSNAAVFYSTITGNHAFHPYTFGGGIVRNSINIHGSIVAGNTAGDIGHDLSPAASSPAVNYSIIGDNDGTSLAEAQTPDAQGNLIGSSAGGGVIDPLLAPLADNGGPTHTHALLPGSPAIDAGDPGFTPPPDFDQRGNPFARVIGGRIDIGAYERQTAPGTNQVVDTTVDEDDGNHGPGDLSLREAIGLANASPGDDTVSFDAAVFGTPQTILLSLGQIDITETITLNGPGQELVTVDGQQVSRIFDAAAPDVDVTILGMTLAGGQTTADNLAGRGGAIRSQYAGTVLIDQSTISGNSTMGDRADGGAIYAGGDVVVMNSTISGNSTNNLDSEGGAIAAEGSVSITDSTFSGNSTDGGGSDGGAVYAAGELVVLGSLFSGNSTGTPTTSRGGAIFSDDDATVAGSTFVGNSTGGSNSDGGAIFGDLNTTLTIVDSTFSGNFTSRFGAQGGAVHTRGSLAVENSTFSGNNSFSHGGAIATEGTTEIAHSTITGNHAGNTGGGFWNYNDPVTINHTIIADNTADDGNADLNPSSGSLTVIHSLIGDNDGVALAEAPTADAQGNLIGSSAGGGVIDPLLAPLADNGGPTQTHVPLAGSPAIDAGDPAFTPPPNNDQRGAAFPRIIGGRIDIGAVEAMPTPLGPSADFDLDTIVSGRDFLLWQIGHGTPAPNAVKGDGDADNDMDVDGDDLAAWEAQFGRGVTLAAVHATLAEPPTSTTRGRSQWVDAAMAVDLLHAATARTGVPLIEQNGSAIEEVAYVPQAGFNPTPRNRLATTHHAHTTEALALDDPTATEDIPQAFDAALKRLLKKVDGGLFRRGSSQEMWNAW